VIGSQSPAVTTSARRAGFIVMSGRRVRVQILAPIVVVTLLVAAWWAVVAVQDIPAYVFPTPWEVFQAVTGRGWAYLPDVWITSQEVFVGFGVGVAAGLILAALMTMWFPLRAGLYPVLIFSQVVPIFIVAVVVEEVSVNDGLLPQIIVTALYSFLPLVVTGMVGFENVDPDLIRLLRAGGASDGQIFVHARIASALPSIFGGAKLALIFAVGGAVVSEWIGIGSSSGLGYYMRVEYGSYEVPQVIAGAVVLTMVGALMFLILGLVERLAIPWNRTIEGLQEE
jgi:NitT/TauT family transport system permease protein